MKSNKFRPQSSQRGAALVMALAVLVLLTILGISAMKSSTLEYRMASSIQDKSTAFQAAESGLAASMKTVGLNPNQASYYTYYGKSGVKAEVETSFGGTSGSNTTRSEKPDGTGTRWYHFEQKSVATLNSGATTTVEAGFKQRANAN
ncbi:MAG: pilus assembly PilX family protein [Acidiferrobacterales bacterium]